MRAWTAVLLPLLVFLAAPAQAKSYHLARTDITADVRADGSMHVSETREFVFRGNFHAVDRFIDLPRGTTIENVAVSEGGTRYRQAPGERPGTFTASQAGARVAVTWGYDATDETRTFVLEFDIIGAVEKHADVAELYWQFIGSEWHIRSDTSRIVVNLPSAVAQGDLKAWAHGPPWGDVLLEEDRVVYTCDPLPPDQTVEARILFPTSVIAQSARQDSASALGAVMAEEDEWVRDANAARRSAKIILVAKWAFPILLAIGAIVTWVTLYLSFGREHKPATEIEYLRDIPNDWTPNQVAAVWRWGELGPSDMTATLMDLVRRGALKLIVTTESRPVLGGLLGEKTEQ
jgi:uncharacterized membrane protein